MKNQFAVVLRAPYAYDADLASEEAGFVSDGPSMTKQAFAEESDINVIVERFMKSGVIPEIRMPISGDFTDVQDFRGCMDAVVKARESFDELPAAVRARFQNDPAQFVDFCLVEENWDEAMKLGLISEEAVARKAAKHAEEVAAERKRIEEEYAANLEKAKAKPAPAS